DGFAGNTRDLPEESLPTREAGSPRQFDLDQGVGAERVDARDRLSEGEADLRPSKADLALLIGKSQVAPCEAGPALSVGGSRARLEHDPDGAYSPAQVDGGGRSLGARGAGHRVLSPGPTSLRAPLENPGRTPDGRVQLPQPLLQLRLLLPGLGQLGQERLPGL